MIRPVPVLSVVIPVWNGERYLTEAITSVLHQQDAPALEVIVVDDGSTDDSAAVAQRFGPAVSCVRIAHRGLSAARNAGAELARGEYLLHLDSDDVLTASSLSRLMAGFCGQSAVDIVVGQMISFVSPELGAEMATRFRTSPEPRRGGLPGASVIRAGFAARVGCFDEARTHSPDLDWMARAVERGPRVVDVEAVVLRRRIHGGNLSLSGGDVTSDRLAIVRAAMNRRSRPTPDRRRPHR